MNKSNLSNQLPKAKIYGTLTKTYLPLEEIDPKKEYDEHDIVDFQVGLLFGIVHQN